jgi:hypothetical protein
MRKSSVLFGVIMGETMETFTITITKSSHNSVQDKIDDLLWEDLKERIAALCEKEIYKSISPLY